MKKLVERKKFQLSERSMGFTLIELLVAITIFVMITGIAAVSYQQANRGARDGRRRSDLEQIRAALEIYRVDQDEYPPGAYAAMIGTLQAGPVYINITPDDPRPDRDYFYVRNALTDYDLCAALEGAVVTPCPVPGAATCGAIGACTYCVCNP